MTKKVRAVFDGRVLRPEEPVDLKVNGHYLLKIEPLEKKNDKNRIEDDPAYDLSSLAVKTGIADLASEHDHYLYGVSKREASE
jgi:hypothetical protein